MKEFVEKLIERLEEEKEAYSDTTYYAYGVGRAIKIVNQLAEEYKTSFMEQLLEAKKNCGEDSDCSECPFGQIEDRCILNELQIESDNNGWVPVSDKLPEKDMWCLATFESGGIDKIQYLASQKWWNGEMGDNRVIAWQPLPEPFKPIAE